MTRIVTPEELEEFLELAQQVVNASYFKFMPYRMDMAPTLAFDKITARNKYARIWVTTRGDHRSSWGFIGLEDGNVWKCDGWKKPALNFPRGNIYDNDHGLNRAEWTGVS